MKAIILGSTGLVGNDLLKRILNSAAYDEVLSISRSPLNIQHPKLKELIIDLDKLADHTTKITGDVVFCCLGTTKKQTPDKALYRKIDYQYPLDVAKIALKNGASQYHLISAMGANPNSQISYSKLKGEVEEALKSLLFKATYIYRPALLDGERKDHRTVEKFMIHLFRAINPILVGPLAKYRSVKAVNVAKSMLNNSIDFKPGIHIIESDQMT